MSPYALCCCVLHTEVSSLCRYYEFHNNCPKKVFKYATGSGCKEENPTCSHFWKKSTDILIRSLSNSEHNPTTTYTKYQIEGASKYYDGGIYKHRTRRRDFSSSLKLSQSVTGGSSARPVLKNCDLFQLEIDFVRLVVLSISWAAQEGNNLINFN